MGTKQCSKCGEAKVTNDFNRDKRAKDGLYGYCRACARTAARTWRASNLERSRANGRERRAANRKANLGADPYTDPAPKTCSHCRVELPRSEFTTKPSARDGLYEWCRPCAAAGKRSNTCPACGVACRRERCVACGCVGVYHPTTVGRRADRWTTETNLYIKRIEDLSGTKHWKIGIGTLERANLGGTLAVCLAMPLARALYIEQRVLAVHGYQADKDAWPMKGGHTECVRDFGLMFELRHASVEEVEAWLAERSSDEELTDAV